MSNFVLVVLWISKGLRRSTVDLADINAFLNSNREKGQT